jgi:CarboxypepD_reg-like domain
MRYITTFFISFLIIRGLSAQPPNYALSGSVRDSATGKPIPAVSVFLNGTSKGTVTNDDGTFFLDGIPPGGYLLVISAIGYATFQTEIDTRHLPPNLNVILQTLAVDLAADTVEPGDKNGWRDWGR